MIHSKTNKINFFTFLFFSGIFSTILFDLYHPIYGKIFDIIGYGLILLSLILSRRIFIQKFTISYTTVLWVIPILAMGFISIYFAPLTAMSIIAGIFISITCSKYFYEELLIYGPSLLSFCQKFLFLTQIVQIVTWIITGNNLDFGELIGFSTSRNFGSEFFRASGILAEANGMAVTQSLLFLSLINFRKKTSDIIIFLISVFITFSLQGSVIFLISALSFFFTYKSKKEFVLKALISVVIIFLILFLSIEYIGYVYNIFAFRLSQLDEDPSLNARLLRPITMHFYEFISPHPYDIYEAVNYGPSNSYFNGFYFFGFFFILLLFDLLKKYYKAGFLSIIILLVTLLSYQLYSTALFWVSICFLLVKHRNIQISKNENPIIKSS
jgi:hypothetical protein